MQLKVTDRLVGYGIGPLIFAPLSEGMAPSHSLP